MSSIASPHPDDRPLSVAHLALLDLRTEVRKRFGKVDQARLGLYLDTIEVALRLVDELVKNGDSKFGHGPSRAVEVPVLRRQSQRMAHEDVS